MPHRARTRWLATLSLGLVAAAPLAFAQNNAAPSGAKSESKVIPTPDVPPDSITEGSVKVGGTTVDYRAVAGTLTVGSTDPQDAMIGFDGKYLADASIDMTTKPEDRPATARIFYTAYFQKNPAKSRPITFLYNGGPGSATMYLHMGAFGPERLVLPQESAHQEGAPYQIVPNEYSLLDASDLVFIDAPGTGFSRIYGKDAGKGFYGTDPDAHAFDRFIRRFLSKYDRWNSPKYLFGESYGTTRTAVLTNLLQRHWISTDRFSFRRSSASTRAPTARKAIPARTTAYFLALPSMAATSWYHHRVPNQPAQLEPLLKEVEQFSLGAYASALLQGSDLAEAQKKDVAAKLESYTGVPAAYWVKAIFA